MAPKAPAVEQSAWPLIPIPLQPFQTVNIGVKSVDKTTKVTQISVPPKGWQSYAADGRQSIQSFWVPTLQKSNASGASIRKIKSNNLAKKSDVNKSGIQSYIKKSRKVFDKYLHQAEEKAIEYTELANSLWREIEVKEKTNPQEFLRKKTRFDQGDSEAFGQEYAQAIAARDLYNSARQNPKAILDFIQTRCIAGSAPTAKEIDIFAAKQNEREAIYGALVYGAIGIAVVNQTRTTNVASYNNSELNAIQRRTSTQIKDNSPIAIKPKLPPILTDKGIPENASVRVLKPSPTGGAQYGVEYKWTNNQGQTIRFRVHGPDNTAPIGSNAASGDVYRIQVGTRFMDVNGKLYPRGACNPNSPNYNPVSANATHISWPGT